MKRNEKGFGALVAIFIIVLVVFLGFVAYRMIQDKRDKTQTTAQTSPAKSSSVAPSTSTNTPKPAKIAAWSVEVTLHDASKVQFDVKNESGTIFGGTDTYEAVAQPSFVAGAVKDQSCTPGLSLYRSKTAFPSGTNDTQKKIGGYYYIITGGPGSCENTTDNQLKTQFLKDFTVANLAAM